MKTLMVVTPGPQAFLRAERRRYEVADERPRESLLEDALNADVMDDQYLKDLRSRSLVTRFFYKLLPISLLLALIAYRQRHRYDVVVTWDDCVGLIYAFLLRITRSRSRHVAILSWVAESKKAFALKLFQKGFDRIILWSQTQSDLLVKFSHISPERIVVIPYFVDHNFWRPMNEVANGICSAGDSRRDYATLVEAMRGLDIHCTIATRVKPSTPSKDDRVTGQSIAQISGLPENVVFQAMSLAQMRAMYARSLFVVVPLYPSFRDSGITIITQAMAMGKAVICSRIQGQLEFLEDGITGIFVPPGNPQALRETIEYLWEHPDVAEQMGIEGRRRAEEIFSLTQFVANVQQVVSDTIVGSRTSVPTIAEQMYALRKSRTEKATKQTGESSVSRVPSVIS